MTEPHKTKKQNETLGELIATTSFCPSCGDKVDAPIVPIKPKDRPDWQKLILFVSYSVVIALLATHNLSEVSGIIALKFLSSL
jgi:hypothetical protein